MHPIFAQSACIIQSFPSSLNFLKFRLSQMRRSSNPDNSNIAIILARGGSKRIPNKNIIKLHGKPLVAWTIEAARDSQKFDKVLLSTDSEDIAEVGLQYGAEVPFLRSEASDDYTPSSEATIFALTQAEKYWKCRYDTVTQLMANCPLRNADDITQSIDNFNDNNSAAQLSCFKFGWMNPWWAFQVGIHNEMNPCFPEALKKRSQDLPKLYCPSGAIWLAKRDHLLTQNSYHGKLSRAFELDWISSVDIDQYEDLQMAEACFLLRDRKNN